MRGTKITIDTLCNIMSDVSRGTEVVRYAAVNDLILNTYEQKCQDFKYSNMVSELSQTNWNSSASEGGMCTANMLFLFLMFCISYFVIH